jgi:hypothetical protein
MEAAWNAVAARVVEDLTRVFGERLQSVVVYGAHVEGDHDAPLRCLALVSSVGTPDLDACARKARGWQRAGIAIPLILPAEEFRQSLDAFPIEYGEILRNHHRVFGPNPFEQIEIRAEDLRRACETQVKSHLIHLREGYIGTDGRPTAIADLVRASAPAFAALLRQVARLLDGASPDRKEAARQGARAANLAEDVVTDVLALESPTGLSSVDPARLFPAYLAAVEQLSRTVDTWRD